MLPNVTFVFGAYLRVRVSNDLATDAALFLDVIPSTWSEDKNVRVLACVCVFACLRIQQPIRFVTCSLLLVI
jgi:hypothetical protein